MFFLVLFKPCLICVSGFGLFVPCNLSSKLNQHVDRAGNSGAPHGCRSSAAHPAAEVLGHLAQGFLARLMGVPPAPSTRPRRP